MDRSRAFLAGLLVLAACQQQPGNDETAVPANAAAATNAASERPAAKAAEAAGCADRLVFAMNPEPSQQALQDHLDAGRLETVRSGTEQRFKAVANAMCAGGDLPATAFDGYDRVVITDAEGASEPNIYAGENRTINYELAFAADQNVPPEAMFRAALLCFRDPNREGCFAD